MKFGERDYGYTIISRFESCLRECILNCLEINNDNWMETIPEGVIISAREKTTDINDLDTLLENIDFIQLKEIIVYKENYKYFFDIKNLEKQKFINYMDSIYTLRNKISHVKSYFTFLDLNALINEIKELLVFLNCEKTEMIEFIDKIMTNPSELVVKMPIDFITEDNNLLLLNNLPYADYDLDGGYVGRAKDKQIIIDMIKKDLHKVITISGAGGVGKTAFVLNVVNEIIRKQIIKYDFVVWVSAKENKLTYLGIENIEPSLKNYDELLNTILSVSSFDSEIENLNESEKENFVNDIFEICHKTLVIIDNLETINDERIINFILDGHPNVRFIVTSRKGLGQVERRYELKQLDEADAITLFKVICKSKQETKLLSINDDIIKNYVDKVYRYPLAIKWTIAQVNHGKDINDVISRINQQTTDISKFCFEQIFSDLSEEEKYILYVLGMYDKPIQKGTIKYISDFNEETCIDSISNLVILSLIVPEDKIDEMSKEINKYYSLMPLTKGFVLSELDKNDAIKCSIQSKLLSKDNILEEADRAQKVYKYSLSNFGASTEEEKIASVLCQTAFQQYQANDYEEAVESYKKASRIAPQLAAVYRNWAIMESNEGHIVAADELMEKASKINPNDVQIWLVWGNIKRKNDKILDADKYYKKAYALSSNDVVVLNSLAQAESRLGNYEFADKLLNMALNNNENNSGENNRHKIINYTSLAENLIKWSQSLLDQKKYEDAEIKSKLALKYMINIYNQSRYDERSKKAYIKALFNAARLLYIYKKYNESKEYYEELVAIDHSKYYEREYYIRGCLGLSKIHDKLNNKKDRKKYIELIEKEIKRISKRNLIEEFKDFKEKISNDI